MRLSLLAVALALSPYGAAAQPLADDARYAIERSVVTTLEAADGHRYRVLIAWPDAPAPAAGWPVLYVLDGGDNFAIVTETARRLARAGKRSGVEPGLVVAVDSGTLPRRVFDYTPATPGYAVPKGAPAHGIETGGADAFLAFVADKLQPMVTARWSVDRHRQAILGHSFGGLTVLHALFTRPALFDIYVVVSPSLWFGENLMRREERGFAPRAGLRVLVTTGADEGGPDANSGAAAAALVARLAGEGVSARYLSLNGQSHGTTMLASMGEAITTAFGKGVGP